MARSGAATWSWYDAIVVGGGVVGSYTAYHLAKNGLKTLLIEQFLLPHSRGSSNGQSRIFSNTYREDTYAKMLKEAMHNWWELEKESGMVLFKKTGLLMIEDRRGSTIPTVKDTMKRNNIECKLISGRQLKEDYPMLSFPDDHQGLLDEQAGILFASKCIATLQEQFRKLGGVIRDGEQVKDVKAIDGGVMICGTTGRYLGRKVVLCPGPWSSDLLKITGLVLPLTTMTGHQFYFQSTDPALHDVNNGMPIVYHQLYLKEGYQFVISKPICEYPGLVKIASRGQPMLSPRHPDQRDFDFEEITQFIVEYIRKHQPHLDTKPRIMDPGVYCMTPDRHFVIDRHPLIENVFIGCGFSGTGFKMAPVTGKLLTEMVQGKEPSYDLSPFKISRFFQTAKL